MCALTAGKFGTVTTTVVMWTKTQTYVRNAKRRGEIKLTKNKQDTPERAYFRQRLYREMEKRLARMNPAERKQAAEELHQVAEKVRARMKEVKGD